MGFSLHRRFGSRLIVMDVAFEQPVDHFKTCRHVGDEHDVVSYVCVTESRDFDIGRLPCGRWPYVNSHYSPYVSVA